MKKVLILTIIASLAVICPVLATQWVNHFNDPSDITGVTIGWNNAPGNGIIAPLSICSTNAHNGSGCLQITLTTDSMTSTQNQLSLNFDGLPSVVQGSGDSVVLMWSMTSSGLSGGGWWLFAQDNGWSWEPQGSYPWQAPGQWSCYTQILAMTALPYHRVGVQIDMDDSGNEAVPPTIWLVDDWSVGPPVLDVHDWSIMDSPKAVKPVAIKE